ncbi:hypothetical protein, conserved [Leishmania tarentolae]|uniref:Uncharacterized protein n=1 Tax=Leishmania tarentolae TaxID=5689 RepID=A0A640KL43_LEITA|nr:hypothetical protein, conserved [Leishmania tarentolae]
MELHPLETAAVRILFCGRPALTTGIVNLRVLLGGNGQYCLAEKRKAKPHCSHRNGTRRDAVGSNGVGVDSEEKRESVYRICSSEGLPQGCYYVKADRHYWVMHMKGGLREAVSTTEATAAPVRPSASVWNTQVTATSSSVTTATTVSAAVPSNLEEGGLARSTKDQGNAASVPAAATARPSSVLARADDTTCASVASKQQVTSTKRRCARRLKAVYEAIGSPQPINTTFSNPAPLADVSPTQEQQQEGASMHTVENVGDAEAALGEPLLGLPLSVQQSPKVAADDFGIREKASYSQQQQETQWERRKKVLRVHMDAVAEEGKDATADAVGCPVSTKNMRDSSRASGESNVDGAVVGCTPAVGHLTEFADTASKPPKKPKHRGKRLRSEEVTAENLLTLPPVQHPRTQDESLASSFPESSPLPTPEKRKTTRRKMGLNQGGVEASVPASSANVRDTNLLLPSAVTDSDTESAPVPASPARKSRKSSATTSAASTTATSDAADTVALLKIPTPPLSPLPHRPVPSARESTRSHEKRPPSHTDTSTASLSHLHPRQAPPHQRQQEEESNPHLKCSPASAPQETTPNVPYSNRSSGVCAETHSHATSDVMAPTPRDTMREQKHGRNSATNSPITRSQGSENPVTLTRNLLMPPPSPLLQRQSQWGGIGDSNAGSRGFHEGMMNGGGDDGVFPSESPALGFTQVHSTLAEEFSLDMSESESSSAASEYLYDVEV